MNENVENVEIKNKLTKKEEIKENTFKDYFIEVPKRSEKILDHNNTNTTNIETFKGKFKLSKIKDDTENKKKNEYKIFKKEEIDKISSRYSKKKFVEKSIKDLISPSKEKENGNDIELIINKSKKQNLNLQSDEEIEENINQKFKKSMINNNIKKINKINKNINFSEDDENENIINKGRNLNNLSYSRNGLMTNIKIYKCVIWKNSDPNINEDILRTIMHYRNRSQGNKSFIMKLPDDIDFEKNLSNNKIEQNKNEDNINNIKDNNHSNSNISFRIKPSKSYVNLYKKSYYKK